MAEVKANERMVVAKTGNEAMAEAMRQINPDVVAAYPITPATEIVQIFSQFVADGLVKSEFVAVESEHSAMSACIGSCAAGARTMTGTSSQGLALMHEMLFIAAGLRLPIVMPVVNRALSSPINIHCDHSDTMGSNQAGWIQIFSEDAQEAYHNTIIAVRAAEKASLPAMVTTDGFIISHAMQEVNMLADKEVQDFIGPYKMDEYLLDIENPKTWGGLDFTDFYFEHKRQQIQGMIDSIQVIKDADAAFAKLIGRKYEFFEGYKLEDAEVAIVVLGSTAGTAKVVVDELRAAGKKVGLLKVRVFRPFDVAGFVEKVKHLKAIAVLDRSDAFNAFGGPVFMEARSSLYDLEKRPKTANYVYGLGGRDINMDMIKSVYNDLLSGGPKEKINYLGVRE